jgi:hypothetical protein
MPFKVLEKQEQAKLQISTWKEIVMIRAKMESKGKTQSINKTRVSSSK